VRESDESEIQMGERVAKLLAAELGLVVTSHTAAAKAEYEKQYLLALNQSIVARSLSASELQHMARQVGAVLPFVPHDVIVRDLGE
jgi:hypothetical protein